MAERSSHGSRGPRRSSGGERHGFGRGHGGQSRRGSGSSYRGADGSRGEGGYKRRDAGQGRAYGDGDRRRSARDGGDRGRSYGDGERRTRSYGDGERRGQGGRGSGSRGQGLSRGGRAGRGFGGRDTRSGERRDSRPPQRHRVPEPAVPEEVQAADLEASARRELRGLGRANAENVSRHLVMVQRLPVSFPEIAAETASVSFLPRLWQGRKDRFPCFVCNCIYYSKKARLRQMEESAPAEPAVTVAARNCDAKVSSSKAISVSSPVFMFFSLPRPLCSSSSPSTSV